MTRSGRPSKRRLEAVARSLEAARSAIRAMADREDGRAYTILREQSYEEAVWTAGYLLRCMRAMTTVFAGGDPKEASRLLHAGADGVGNDIPVAEAEVIVTDALNRLMGV